MAGCHELWQESSDWEFHVDDTTQVQVGRAAQALLNRYRDAHSNWTDTKTPLEELAAWLGLTIATFHHEDYPDGTFGFMDDDEDENLIWLRRDLQENFRRFTLAHEIGHAILHSHEGQRLIELSPQFADLALAQNGAYQHISRSDTCKAEDVQEDFAGFIEQEQLRETLGAGHAYNPRSERELAANLFAAELLLPGDRLNALYLDQEIPANTLAALFGVSQAALLNRLTNLLSPALPDQNETLAAEVQTEPAAQKQQQYDEFQLAAIQSPTPALVSAGPGSGKTSTLIGRVVYTINELGVASHAILALTFSRKATLEMEERLRGVLAATTAMLPRVSTIHAFCADLLRQHGHLLGLREELILVDEAEGYFILKQQLSTMHLRHLQKLHDPTYCFSDILKAISRAKDELITPAQYSALAREMLLQARDDEQREDAEKAEETARIYANYEMELQRRGSTDFGGLLMLAIQLLREHADILQEQQRAYPYILVDEFQDINRASSILLQTLAGEQRRIWVVGDANQAIYAFRGASPANIARFAQDFPGAALLSLSRNYRSQPDLVAIAESFRYRQLELGEEPGKNQPVRLTHDTTAITIAHASNEANELQGIAQDIQRKVAQGFRYRDIAVLCRTRAQVQHIMHSLTEASLPVYEQRGILTRTAIKDVLAILLLLTAENGMGLLRVAQSDEYALSQQDLELLLTAARQDAKHDLRSMLIRGELPIHISVEGQHTLNRLGDVLQSLQQTLLIEGKIWSCLAQYLFLETEIIRRELRLPQAQHNLAALADYATLLQLARHYDQQRQARQAGEDERTKVEEQSIEEQLREFLDYLTLLVTLRQDGVQRKYASDEEEADIIRVMTVHGSKGLEFPVVYIPGLVKRRFPAQAHAQPLPLPEKLRQAEDEEDRRQEINESCLFYVGVTRARDALILSYSDRYGKMAYKRSPYLDALEAGLPEERVHKLQWDDQRSEEAEHTDEESMIGEVGSAKLVLSAEFLAVAKPKRLNVSAIEAYQRCPRPADGYQLFWRATQQTVETLSKKGRVQETKKERPTAQEAQELYQKHWQEVGGHLLPFAVLYEQHGQEVVEALQQQLQRDEAENWQLKTAYGVEVEGRVVEVIVDRVENARQEGQPAKFVRTRFGRREEKPAAETRELFYTLASRQQHPQQPVELQQHNMSTGEITTVSLSAKKEQALYAKAKQALAGLESDEYPARPQESARCPTCPFFFICPT